MIVKKFTLGNDACTRRTIEFPNGKKLVFTRGFSYTSSDQKEIDFLSRGFGLMMNDLSVEDMKVYFSKLPVVPTLDTKITDEEAKKYLWFDKDEEYVIDNLLKRGYISKKTGNERDTIMAVRKEMRMKGLKDEELLEEVEKRKLNITKEIIKEKEVIKTVEKEPNLSEQNLVASLKKLGYTIYRKPTKKT